MHAGSCLTSPESPSTPVESIALHADIARGSAWSLATQLAVLVLTFVATPFLIRGLSPERFGAFVLIQLILGFLAVNDAGMGDASTRFASAAHAANDDVKEARVVWTAFSLSAIATAGSGVVLLLLAPLLVTGVVPEYLRPEATVAMDLAILVLAARAFAGVLKSPQIARLRLDIFSVIGGGAIAAPTAVLPIAVALDSSLDTAVFVLAVAAIVM